MTQRESLAEVPCGDQICFLTFSAYLYTLFDDLHWVWKMRYKRENGHQPSVEEIRAKKQELIASIPTNEEYRETLFKNLQLREQ